MASFLTLGLILYHGNIWEMRAKGTDLHHRFLMTTLLPQYTAVVYVALLYFLQFGIMLLFSVKGRNTNKWICACGLCMHIVSKIIERCHMTLHVVVPHS